VILGDCSEFEIRVGTTGEDVTVGFPAGMEGVVVQPESITNETSTREMHTVLMNNVDPDILYTLFP
jgi:hypothetical protein